MIIMAKRQRDWARKVRNKLRKVLGQYAAGNLRLLCAPCNGKKGSTEDKRYHAAALA